MKKTIIPTLLTLVTLASCSTNQEQSVIPDLPDQTNKTEPKENIYPTGSMPSTFEEIEPEIAKWASRLYSHKNCTEKISIEYINNKNKTTIFEPNSLAFIDASIEEYKIKGCNKTKTLNFMVLSNENMTKTIPTYPGSGITDFVVFNDAQVQAFAAIYTNHLIPNIKGCTDFHIENTELILKTGASWIEKWQYGACGKIAEIYGTFMPVGKGWSYTFSKEKPQP
jgi:hypothetical protein